MKKPWLIDQMMDDLTKFHGVVSLRRRRIGFFGARCQREEDKARYIQEIS